MKLLNYICTIAVALSALIPLSAHGQQLSDEDRERYITEIRAYKHDFLSRSLELTPEKQREFFELYDEMEDRVMQIGSETRELVNRVEAEGEADEEALEAATDAMFGQKQKEADVENEFYAKFKEVLTPRQLFKLKGAERKFNQQLMRQHRRVRSEDRGRGPRR